MVLKEIHKANILHGDICLQNLLINPKGHAVIIDFDRVRKTSSTKAKEEECKQLLDVLGAEEA
jgi:tRNA A-37 threonylcarbamoyl transferase component Bud32